MHAEPLLKLSHHIDREVVVVQLSGEADISTTELLRDYLVRLVDEGHHHLVLDLAELGFMDSSGLAVLAGVWRRLKPQSGVLALVHASARLRKILHVTRLDLAFSQYDTVPEAVAAAHAA